MTIPDAQQWLSPQQVADAFGKNVTWVYDQIKVGKSNRAGTNGIPARFVKKVGGSLHVHRDFVFPRDLQPANVVAFPQPAIDAEELAAKLIEFMWVGIGERFGFTVKDRAAS